MSEQGNFDFHKGEDPRANWITYPGARVMRAVVGDFNVAKSLTIQSDPDLIPEDRSVLRRLLRGYMISSLVVSPGDSTVALLALEDGIATTEAWMDVQAITDSRTATTAMRIAERLSQDGGRSRGLTSRGRAAAHAN